jgi:crotonobetainyl-CoA:carnitine CoA-transferase CaiB-like acyl-CoA transferase
MDEPKGPLTGLRIIDLTNVLFGPLATPSLGDWDADVIKVEGLSGDLVSNIRPAGLARLGFDYARCKKLNSRIVYVSATGFGQNGPWSARPAIDEIIQASS